MHEGTTAEMHVAGADRDGARVAPIASEAPRTGDRMALLACPPPRGAALSRDHGTSGDVQRLEAELRQAQKMASLGLLVGGLAHDLNNLLGIVQAYAQLVAADLEPGTASHDDLQQLLAVGRRASSLVRKLLSVARGHADAPMPVDLDVLVADMQALLRALVGSRVEIVHHRSPDPAWILADPGQIEQILLNLAANARDAMPNGGRLSFRIGCRAFEAGEARQRGIVAGEYVVLHVSDTGVGMDEATRAQIFDVFFTTKPEGKGTGLGLATLARIVREAGGAVTVHSRPGEGTAFTIAFPRCADSIGCILVEECTLVAPRESELQRMVG